MVEYFIPEKIIGQIENRVKEYQFKNEYNKAVAGFDSSSMDTDKQLIHNIMKLKASVTREVYSDNIESVSKELLDSICSRRNDIIKVSEKAEPMLIKAIEYCFNQKKIFMDDLENDRFYDKPTEGMIVNYQMQYASYEFVTKIDDSTNLDSIRKSLNEKLEPLKPINNFRKLVEESEGKILTFESWIGDLKVEAPVQDIKITDDDITIKIPYAVYHLKKGPNVSIRKVAQCRENKEYEWQYELHGNGEVTVGLRK